MSDPKKPIVKIPFTEVARVDDKDWFLQQLVDFVNDHGFIIPVTLSVSGQLITGTLISGKDYFDKFSNQFAKPLEANEPELYESLNSIFEQHKAIYDIPIEQKTQPPNYLHLADAFILESNNITPTSAEGFLWRGMISSVDGFSLGKLTYSKG